MPQFIQSPKNASPGGIDKKDGEATAVITPAPRPPSDSPVGNAQAVVINVGSPGAPAQGQTDVSCNPERADLMMGLGMLGGLFGAIFGGLAWGTPGTIALGLLGLVIGCHAGADAPLQHTPRHPHGS